MHRSSALFHVTATIEWDLWDWLTAAELRRFDGGDSVVSGGMVSNTSPGTVTSTEVVGVDTVGGAKRQPKTCVRFPNARHWLYYQRELQAKWNSRAFSLLGPRLLAKWKSGVQLH